ncbi:MAG: hypothetical protein AUK08_01105 [Candidatus Pacebacteria bacterium CG2_30_36_39]|nr:hypothetical protein [Candidatus Pacearchaeota archaeon]OIP74367.1 MAG: hypothetical protein AUK08_01105 [Candidatus Pacebacteria bacterium CG2_30_36_39]
MPQPRYAKSLQPHSGAVIMALYHFLKHPDKLNFDIRMTEPFSRVYRIILEGRTRDELIFRTGKDWPCYSRIYFHSNNTEFRIQHDHSPVKEEFRIEGRKLYMGDLRTESGMRVEFEGEFFQPTTLELKEDFRLPDGRLINDRRYYQVDSAW